MNPFVALFNLFAIAPVVIDRLLGLEFAKIASPAGWHSGVLGYVVSGLILFGLAGIAMAMVGYRLCDTCMPDGRSKQPVE